MPILYPSADVSVADWETGGGSGSNLYAEINEGSGVRITIGSGLVIYFAFGKTSAERVAQHFISQGTTIASVRVWMRLQSTPSDGVICKVYATDGSHHPTGSQIGATSNTIPYTSLNSSTATLCDFTFTPPVTVTDSTEYAFVLERTGSLSDSAYYFVYVENASGYTNGYFHYFTSAAWVAGTTSDIVCVIHHPVGLVDYIATEGGTAKFELTDPSGDIVAATMRVSFRKDGDDNANLTVRLLQNDGGSETVVAEWEYTDIADTDTDIEVALTAPQLALVTDPSDLRIEFEASVEA